MCVCVCVCVCVMCVCDVCYISGGTMEALSCGCDKTVVAVVTDLSSLPGVFPARATCITALHIYCIILTPYTTMQCVC